MNGLPFPVRRNLTERYRAVQTQHLCGSAATPRTCGLPLGSSLGRHVAPGSGYQRWLPFLRSPESSVGCAGTHISQSRRAARPFSHAPAPMLARPPAAAPKGSTLSVRHRTLPPAVTHKINAEHPPMANGGRPADAFEPLRLSSRSPRFRDSLVLLDHALPSFFFRPPDAFHQVKCPGTRSLWVSEATPFGRRFPWILPQYEFILFQLWETWVRGARLFAPGVGIDAPASVPHKVALGALRNLHRTLRDYWCAAVRARELSQLVFGGLQLLTYFFELRPDVCRVIEELHAEVKRNSDEIAALLPNPVAGIPNASKKTAVDCVEQSAFRQTGLSHEVVERENNVLLPSFYVTFQHSS